MPLSQVEITMGRLAASNPEAKDLVAVSRGAVSAEKCKNFLLFILRKVQKKEVTPRLVYNLIAESLKRKRLNALLFLSHLTAPG